MKIWPIKGLVSCCKGFPCSWDNIWSNSPCEHNLLDAFLIRTLETFELTLSRCPRSLSEKLHAWRGPCTLTGHRLYLHEMSPPTTPWNAAESFLRADRAGQNEAIIITDKAGYVIWIRASSCCRVSFSRLQKPPAGSVCDFQMWKDCVLRYHPATRWRTNTQTQCLQLHDKSFTVLDVCSYHHVEEKMNH